MFANNPHNQPRTCIQPSLSIVMATILPLEAEKILLPSPDLTILELVSYDLPLQNTVFAPSTIEDFFHRSQPTGTSFSEILLLPEPSSEVLAALHRYLEHGTDKDQYHSVRCLHSSLFKDKTYPLWIISYWTRCQSVRTVRDSWRQAENYLQERLQQWKRKDFQKGITVVLQILEAFATLRWSDQLRGLTGNGTESINSLALFASERWITGEHANQMLDLLRRKLQRKQTAAEVLSTWAYEKMKEGFHSQDQYEIGNSFKMLRVVGEELGSAKLDRVALLVNVNRNHWVATVIDRKERKLLYGDSLRSPMKSCMKDVFAWWIKRHTGIEFGYGSLPITPQNDSFSCGIFAVNALTAFLLDGEDLVPVKEVIARRLEVMKDLLHHHQSHLSTQKARTEPISNHFHDDDSDKGQDIQHQRTQLPRVPPTTRAESQRDIVLTPSPASLPSSAEPPTNEGSNLQSSTDGKKGLFKWFSKGTTKDRDDYFAREDDKHRAKMEDEEHIADQLEQKKLCELRDRAKLRQQKCRAARKAEEIRWGTRDENGQKKRVVTLHLAEGASRGDGTSMAEHTRPARALRTKFHSEKKKPQGRKLKNEPRDAKYHNWFMPMTWLLIEKATKKAGWEMSPTEIVKQAKQLNPQIFEGLSRTTVTTWIDRSTGKPRWKDEVLNRVKQGYQPGHHNGGRSGILGKHPDVAKAIEGRLLSLQKANAPITVVTIRGIILATITTMKPEMLEARFSDGSTFKASDSFVRAWVKHQLNWVQRKATRAAQKIPDNWEDLCERSTIRKIHLIKEYDIPSRLYVNSDQTQVVYAPGNKLTYADSGSKQVSLVGGDEKRAFTVMVSVSNDGLLLPFQAIYEGKTLASTPSATSPHYNDLINTGALLEFSGTTTYWSNMKTMKNFVCKILNPYFDSVRRDLNLPTTQKALWQIDVWSVHRSVEFRDWMKKNYPNIILDYVPGGCTGLYQPCDVGIQRPFKQSVVRSYHESVVQEMITHFEENNEIPAYDKRIATLRNRSVTWLWNAYRTINKPELVTRAFELCRVRGWNLSFKSLTSFEAREKLRGLRTADPVFWEELNSAGERGLPAENTVVDEDMEADTLGGDELGDDSSYSVPEVINAVLNVGGGPEGQVGVLVPSNLAENGEAEPIEWADGVGTSGTASGALFTENRNPADKLGKRKRVANRWYAVKDFIHHDDNDPSDQEDQ
ncbi:hypothetical protein D9613_005664 [Agrocybe pediades]|uniref:Ubiquitin-like protease family profile domain-containing protein n=1 Tax=Agrocybe pediades TaxID=84607 RepID=A0A8H4VRD6_9AGAR|nr:hypothetical protein D9613_005664 [Agrocybe pediades]